MIPDKLWGNYDIFGWTANGIAPFGVQPDPVDAKGMLFYKAWLNLDLNILATVSPERHAKYESPGFTQSGVGDAKFAWTHSRLAERTAELMNENGGAGLH